MSIYSYLHNTQVENSYAQYYYVFHGRVTLFFADNFSTECRITMKFLHNFFQTVK